MWPSTGRARREVEAPIRRTISPMNAGKRKKIELCAARRKGARNDGEIHQGQFGNTLFLREKPPTEFFTESLILAQNERWRRV